MLKVLPIQDKKMQEMLCTDCNITYNADLMAYSIESEGIFIGIVTFAIKNSMGMIYEIACKPGVDDFDALMIAGRTALNFLDLNGIHQCRMEGVNEKNERLAKAVGFKKLPDGQWFVNLVGFFDEPCLKQN